MANQITPALLDLIRVDLKAALEAVGQKHGVQLQLGRGSYTQLNATLKLEINAIGEDGVVTKEAGDLKRYANMLGLTNEHLTQVFKLGNESYVLSGYRAKASAKPFLVKRLSDSKEFIVSEPTIKQALGIKEAPLTITRIR